MDEWIQIYSAYQESDLDAEIAFLRSQTTNPFNSQTEGNRSYSRSTAEIRDRLSAAIRVKQARSTNHQSTIIIADFSRVRP